MKLEFSIDSWTTWSASLGARFSRSSSIYSHAENNNAEYSSAEVGGNQDLNLSLIPAMKRRRMNHQCKMAISTALDCLGQSDLTEPLCVFASQHGELGRSTKIIKSMIETGDISPTDFSLSVHNTALGLLSILSANHEAGTSIAGGDDTFGYGFLEACLQLQAEPTKSVLYVYFDEPLPTELAQFEQSASEFRCLAIILTANAANKPRFAFTMSETDEAASKVLLNSQGLDAFVDFCGLPDEPLSLNTTSHQWCWKRL